MLKETQHTSVTLDGRRIPVSILRHARARRISLRLSPARDGIILTLPRRATAQAGLAFLSSKAGWVLAHVRDAATVAFTDGAVIPVMGRAITLRRMPGRGVTRLEGDALYVHGLPEFTARRARDFLKAYLQRECAARAQAMAARLAKTIGAVRIRDTRSRWGSCTRQGDLTFNWRLVFAGADIVDYLVAHEVAHRVEMNHGERFWKVVAALHPAHEAARSWLKRHGHTLHFYG